MKSRQQHGQPRTHQRQERMRHRSIIHTQHAGRTVSPTLTSSIQSTDTSTEPDCPVHISDSWSSNSALAVMIQVADSNTCRRFITCITIISLSVGFFCVNTRAQTLGSTSLGQKRPRTGQSTKAPRASRMHYLVFTC